MQKYDKIEKNVRRKLKMRKTFFMSVLAGMSIGLGGTVFLSVDNKVIGSLLFAIGLLTILASGFDLFTGKVCFVLDNKLSYIGRLLMIWFGNLVGTEIFANLLRFTRIYDGVSEKAQKLADIKLADTPLSVFLLGIGCGICIYIAVKLYRDTESTFKTVIVIFPVMVFILCGFEHCVANMFYFALCDSYTLKTLGYLMLMTLGNSVGGFLFPLLIKLAGKEKTK